MNACSRRNSCSTRRGGLFDAHGNLLGITTFMLKDAQNLNFAIAAEDTQSESSARVDWRRVLSGSLVDNESEEDQRRSPALLASTPSQSPLGGSWRAPPRPRSKLLEQSSRLRQALIDRPRCRNFG
jgi:hypothetical protein